jgi:restriction endonuclease S subunit
MKWPIKKLGDVLQISRGGSPRPIENYITEDVDGLNWIKIGDVEVGAKYITQTKEKIRKEGLNKTRKVYAGDFLLSNSMSFGRPYITKIDGCIHDGWLTLKDEFKIFDTDFLYHVLSSNAVKEQFQKYASGAVVKNLNVDAVSKVVISIPPLEEQKRIAALLDTADNILQLRETSIAKLDKLAQSLFDEMFGKQVKKIKLKDTCSFVSGGTPSKDEPIYWNGDVAWISSADIEIDQIKNIRHFVTEHAIKNSATNIVPPLSVLVVTRTGVGKVIVTDREICFSQDITGLLLKKEFTPEFIATSIRSKQNEIVKQARGATIKGVTRDVIANIDVPDVTFLEQQRFSERIQTINAQKKYFESNLLMIKDLLASLQHQSFAVN